MTELGTENSKKLKIVCLKVRCRMAFGFKNFLGKADETQYKIL